jgi:hypothetical protein
MKSVAILTALLTCTAGAAAQSHTWADVQRLPVGTGLILVEKSGQRIHCDLVAVKGDTLFCDWARRRLGPVSRETFARGDLRQVRRTHRLANRFAGFALGAGITAFGGVRTLGEAGAPVGAAFFAGGGIPIVPSTLFYQEDDRNDDSRKTSGAQ